MIGKWLLVVVLGLAAGCASAPEAGEGSVLTRARTALLDGRAEEARSLLLALPSRSPEAEGLLGDAWRGLGRREPARDCYFRARDDGDGDVSARASVALGDLALEGDDPYRARIHFQEAGAAAQDQAVVHRARLGEARAAEELGDSEGASRIRSGLPPHLARRYPLPSTPAAPPVVRAPAPRRSSAAAPRSSPRGRAPNSPSAEELSARSGEIGTPPVPSILSRSRWQARPVVMAHGPEPMGLVRLITVHHTASRLRGSGEAAAAAHLRMLQADHQSQREWADLGYHFVIDPEGRVWEGREVRFQGAHAGDRESNRGNLGIALIGDFEEHEPSLPQLNSLRALVVWAATVHRLPADRVQGHDRVAQDHTGRRTACPGKHLNAWLPKLRAEVRSQTESVRGY